MQDFALQIELDRRQYTRVHVNWFTFTSTLSMAHISAAYMLRRRNATAAIVVVFHTRSIYSPIISSIPNRNLCKSFSRSTVRCNSCGRILISFSCFVSAVKTIDLFSLNLWPVVCAAGGLKFDSRFLLFLSSQFLSFSFSYLFVSHTSLCVVLNWFIYFYDCYYLIIIFSSIVIRHFLLIYSFSSVTGKMMPPTNWTRTASAHITCYKISN